MANRMSWLSIVLILLSLKVSITAEACTIFESPFAGDTKFAHNVDWYDRFPNVKGVLVMNPAHLQKIGEVFGAPIPKIQWVSKYRSFSFSIAGAEFPVSGFNEKGLIMGVLELPETVFPPNSDPRGGVGVGQFVQYNLDTAETIDQVEASDKVIRPYSSIAKMHYFACEASGKCMVIQYRDGVAHFFRGNDLPYNIMTNSPYATSAQAAKACVKDASACSPSDSSLQRFAMVARLKTEMKSDQPFTDQALKILNQVVQSAGAVTRFQLIYDPVARTVNVRKRGSQDLAQLKVNFDEADCHGPRRVIPIDANSKGDLSSHWMDLSEAYQTDMVTNMGYPPAMAAVYGKYPFHSVTCQ